VRSCGDKPRLITLLGIVSFRMVLKWSMAGLRAGCLDAEVHFILRGAPILGENVLCPRLNAHGPGLPVE